MPTELSHAAVRGVLTHYHWGMKTAKGELRSIVQQNVRQVIQDALCVIYKRSHLHISAELRIDKTSLPNIQIRFISLSFLFKLALDPKGRF